MIPGRPAPHRLRSGGVVVVGGGLAGLSVALELANHHVPVTIVEANAKLGGMVGRLDVDGYSFDTGPTTITHPRVLTSIFERAGRDPADWLDLVRLDPQWRCIFDDGRQLDLPSDPEHLTRAMGVGFHDFHQFCQRMLRLMEQPNSPTFGFARAKRLHSTAHATIEKLIADPYARRVCERLLHSTGSDPSRTPAGLCGLVAAQIDQGLWYPRGGTHTIAHALGRLATELGIQTVIGHRVTRILVQDQRAIGVKLDDGRVITAAAVVSSCDVRRTYADLLKGVDGAALELRRILNRHETSCSALVLCLGLRTQYEHLAHDTVLFSQDSRREHEDIFRSLVPPRDPTIHITAPSRTDASRAPDGGEALTLLAYTPALTSTHEWLLRGGKPGKTLTRLRSIIIDKLKRHGMGDIEDHIAVERSITPVHLEHHTNAPGGSIYALASHGRLKGLSKIHNHSRVLPNLYLAGGSIVPGPGVPGVLTGGLRAARSLCEGFGLKLSDDNATHGPPE